MTECRRNRPELDAAIDKTGRNTALNTEFAGMFLAN
jgi:hypothetical protein